MNFLSKLFKRPITITMAVLILLLGGVYCTSQMSICLLPDMTLPYLGITVVYPGASAETVEDTVTVELEKAMRAMSGIKNVMTYSLENAGIAIVQYEYGVDFDKKIEEVKDKLETLDFPDACYKPTVTTVDFNATAISTVAVYNTDGDIEKMVADTKLLTEKFSAIDGVGSVSGLGEPESIVRIKTKTGLEMVTLLIVQELTYNSYDIPLGTVSEDGESIAVRNVSNATSVEELEKMNITLTLPKTLLEELHALAAVMSFYESAEVDGIQKIKNKVDELLDNIEWLEGLSNDDLETLREYAARAKAIKTFIDDITLEQLQAAHALVKTVAENTDFFKMSDEEISVLAEKYNIPEKILLEIRDRFNGEGSNMSLGEFFDILEAFKAENPEGASSDAYVDLFVALGIVSDDENDEKYVDPNRLANVVSIVDDINLLALNDVIDTLEARNNGETDKDGNPIAVSDAQYAALFGTLADGKGLILNGTIMGIIRSEKFQEVMNTLIDFKIEHSHEPTDEEAAEYEGEVPQYIPDELTDGDFLELMTMLKIDGYLPLQMTEDLIGFIRGQDYSEISYDADDIGKLNVQLKEIADVTRGNEYSSLSFYNGIASITLKVYGVSGANTTDISKGVKGVLSDNSDKLNGTAILIDDQSEFIGDSISNVLSSMLIGGLLAVIVIYLFLKSVRTSLIIAITMPASVLAAIICMYAMGITLNMVSLGGLAVGIGMLVDNSIVVIESISTERAKGLNAHQSAVNGTKIVVGSLLASTLTSICVFFPILFTKGLTREIFTDLSYAVIFSLSFSLIVAITVIPTLYCTVYSDKRILSGKIFEKIRARNITRAKRKGFKKIFNFGLVGSIGLFYDKVMPKLLRKRWLVILVAVLLFGSSVALVFTTGTEFLPSIDKGVIEVSLDFPASATLSEADDTASQLNQKLKNNVENLDFISMDVGYIGLISTNISAKFTLQLTDKAKKTSEVVEDIRLLCDSVENATVSVTEIDGVVATLTSGMSGLSVSIVGADTDVLCEIAQKVEERFKELDFVRNVQDDISDKAMEYELKIDKTLLAKYGIDYTVLVTTMRAGIAGYTPTTITIDGANSDIIVSFADEAFTEYYSGIMDYTVGFTSDGDVVKLGDVATYELVEKQALISREDSAYILSIDVATYGIDVGSASKELMAITEEVLSDYDGYESRESGVNSYLTEAFSGLIIALIVSFFLLFAVMACQFESLVKPFIVIFSIPFAFTGGFLALLITGTSLNVVSFIGLIMLMGVIVNDAILMVDTIGLKSEEMSPQEAIIAGSKSRLRAILMTTATTVLALLPMALGIGRGSELMQPLGIVAIGGLVVGTLVTLVLIPIIYSLVRHIRFDDKNKPENKPIEIAATSVDETDSQQQK